ncbi:hypothetical protein BC834DRAFT_633342 [Gloeopeniophorella convolvens]|nr:hypothetical protein BC834DRAFT_633342 [Gloeopeniophorella convolvens]
MGRELSTVPPAFNVARLGPVSFGVKYGEHIASAICLGILTFVAFVVAFILCHESFRDKVNIGMLVVVVTMYLNSLVHHFVAIYQAFTIPAVYIDTTTRQKWLGPPTILGWVANLKGSTVLVNVVLSDIIVMWRAWLLWDRSRIVLAISTVLFLATAAIGIWGINRTGGITSGGPKMGTHFHATTFILSTLSLASNLWGFALVAWKAWSHKKLLRQLHNEGFRGSAVGRTLVSFLSPARYTAWSGLFYRCAG